MAIIVWAKSIGGYFTKSECVRAFKLQYYCNAEKHIGDRLSRMVKCGYLVRDKPGHFKVSKGKKNKPFPILEGQQTFF